MTCSIQNRAIATMTSAGPAALFAHKVEPEARTAPQPRSDRRSILMRAAWLLNPGDIVSDLVGARNPDDRMILRLFVNLGRYAKVAMLIVLVFAV